MKLKRCIDCRLGDCDSCYEHDCPCNLSGHTIREGKRPARTGRGRGRKSTGTISLRTDASE